MLCRTCETIIPDNEAQCTKCGNNPTTLNPNYVNIDHIEKIRPYLKIFGVVMQLCHLTFIYALTQSIPLPNWFVASLIISELLYIGIHRFAFIKPLEMRWVFMSIYLPVLPPFLYRKISERTDAIMFITIGAALFCVIILEMIFLT